MDTNNQHACSIKQTPFINELLEHFIFNVRWPTIVKNEEIFYHNEIRTVVHNYRKMAF